METIRNNEFRKLMSLHGSKIIAIDGVPITYNGLLNVTRNKTGYVFNNDSSTNWRQLFGPNGNLGKWKTVTVDPEQKEFITTVPHKYDTAGKKVSKNGFDPNNVVEHAAKVFTKTLDKKTFTASEVEALEQVKQILLNKAVEEIKETFYNK